MADLDASKRRFDETFRRLESVVRAKASVLASVEKLDDATATTGSLALSQENASLRDQLVELRDKNQALKQSVSHMSDQVEAVVKKLDQVLEAGDATA